MKKSITLKHLKNTKGCNCYGSEDDNIKIVYIGKDFIRQTFGEGEPPNELIVYLDRVDPENF